MKCTDCIHNSVCAIWRREEGQDAKSYTETENGECASFKNKFQYLKMPLCVNDTVYVLMMERILTFDVLSVSYFNEDPTFKASHGLHLVWVFGEDSIGKTVFLTRAEAEAALEVVINGKVAQDE